MTSANPDGPSSKLMARSIPEREVVSTLTYFSPLKSTTPSDSSWPCPSRAPTSEAWVSRRHFPRMSFTVLPAHRGTCQKNGISPVVISSLNSPSVFNCTKNSSSSSSTTSTSFSSTLSPPPPLPSSSSFSLLIPSTPVTFGFRKLPLSPSPSPTPSPNKYPLLATCIITANITNIPSSDSARLRSRCSYFDCDNAASARAVLSALRNVALPPSSYESNNVASFKLGG
mmetsp:Transcript_28628/g.42362  ORF Transcript_28628/g.42362 Transcript_28628/m.42362 type:complete len:227 (-) Transcript_28628:202-882(-)